MANDRAPKAASSGGTYLTVAVSIALIVALMGWLLMQDRGRAEATVAEGDSVAAPVAVAGAPPSQVVTSSVFAPNVKSYVGQVIELTDAKFQASLSTQTFWIEMPTGESFLVKLDSAMVAAGTPVPSGGTLDITGTIREKDNALVAQWVASGVLQSDDQRMQAEYGTTYLEAREIRPAAQ